MAQHPTQPRIGVSACLLGTPVRFDGGHKNNAYVHSVLARFATLVPVCPEVESGMPVPRESLRLVERGGGGGVALLGNRSGADRSDQLRAWGRGRVEELARLDLDGFILKKDSPSCGLERVRVYPAEGDRPPARTGTGLFAALLRERLPALPLAEEGWLQDAGLRECFLDRVFTRHRMREALLPAPSRSGLVAFHTDHKLLYLAHSPARYRELGRLVAQAAEVPVADAVERYAAKAMAALGERATPGKHANVLQHVLGYFKGVLSAFEKQELLSLVEEYRAGLQVRSVPLTLLVHHLRKHELGGWLSRQRYFDPYPRALGPAAGA
ncbi:MAG TPA: DUF523 and DUF1722 domain-containing protein [Anaeromyxobacteraceae bacterium]|jgi:uncharacterized protein YbgA (DUF1722 family)/uncharacterized protein YbbK (DUF523 family)|nr:DUF523 and DUF1722 domain-containing protein [Anaeromyxobacteraceae bacterium]